MRKKWTIIGIIIGLPVLLVGLWIVDTSIYPLTSDDPNYADVETAFAKLDFPSDWQEINSTENKGIAGRGCDYFNSSGCFHKSKTFKISESTTETNIKNFFERSGCSDVVSREVTQRGEQKPSYNFRCMIEPSVYLSGTYRGLENEAYISIATY